MIVVQYLTQTCQLLSVKRNNLYFYFYCYTVHVVELLNYYTNHCTYIKFIKLIYVQWLV